MKLNIKKQLPEAGGLIAGGIAGNMLINKLPFGNDKIRPAAALVLGLVLSGQKGFASNIGKGMIVAGGTGLAKSFGIGGAFINGIGSADQPVFIQGVADSTPSGNGEMPY
jgi:hypothetical protein